MASRKQVAPKKDGTTTVYLLIMNDGTKQKITLPSHYILTFGPLAPGSKDTSNNSRSHLSLRIYDGKQQKAVFTDVSSFRDMSIPIEQETVKSQAETFYKEGESGEKQAVVVEVSRREWVNPDAPKGKAEPSQFALPRAVRAVEQE